MSGARPGPFVDGPVTLTVPATSANLGPGFDSLGLALDLRDTLRAEAYDGPLVVDVVGEGAGVVPRDGSHLVVRAMGAAFDALGVEPPGVRLACRNVVPHARGLGSSSAAIVGGLVLARALVVGGERLDDAALLDLATALEGHPDNVAPALLGGFTVAASEAGRVHVARLAVDPAVGAVVLVPPDALSTETARGLLPATVQHADAAADAGRAALLVAALTGRPDLLLPATRDWLHQEQRRPAMPVSLDLVDRLRDRGLAAVVSGAGPSVLVLVTGDQAAEATGLAPGGWEVHTPAVGVAGARVEAPASG